MKRIIIKVNQGRNYLFSTATKPIQFLNGVTSLFFGLFVSFNILEQVYDATVLWWACLIT